MCETWKPASRWCWAIQKLKGKALLRHGPGDDYCHMIVTMHIAPWWWWWRRRLRTMHIARSLRFFIISFASFIRLVGGRGRRGGMLGKSRVISFQHCHHWSHKVTIIVHIVVSWFCSVLTYSGYLAPDRACGGNRDSQPRIKSVGLKKDPDQPSSLSPAAHYYYCCALGSLPLPTLNPPGVMKVTLLRQPWTLNNTNTTTSTTHYNQLWNTAAIRSSTILLLNTMVRKIVVIIIINWQKMAKMGKNG